MDRPLHHEGTAMRALLVVDVQTDVMRGRDTDGLIEACNDVIGRYAPENVVYVVNRMPWEPASRRKELGEGLSMVSDLLFGKRRGSAFSNPGLARALDDMGADEVEVIGIDGNHCIKATALAALRRGLAVTVNTRAVVSRNPGAFERTKRRLSDAGVRLVAG